MVRFGFKIGDDRITVRAMEHGRRIAEVELGLFDTSDMGSWWWQARQDRELAEEQEAQGWASIDAVDYLVHEEQRLHRCLGALETLGDRLRRSIDNLAIVTAAHTSQLDLDELTRMYRVAATVAGRQGATLVAPQCTEYVFGAADNRLPQVWKNAWFRAGGHAYGPVIYLTPALPAAANRRSA